MRRRTALAIIASAAMVAGLPPQAVQAAPPAAFRAFIESLWPDANRLGVTRSLFDAAFAGVVPDPSVAALTRRQPEFVRPIGAYLAAQVTPSRVAAGRRELARWRDALAAIEARYGVPPATIVAVWGLETNYGAAAGNKDVIRSLATLAAMHYRPDLTRTELLAALTMLKDGDVARAALRGSWAGAMGQPQFMPSSFEAYAVDGDGDGRRDIWTSVPDSLASIANFIRAKGWRPDRPWGLAVRPPAQFDPGNSRGAFAEWTARGFVRLDGSPLPTMGDATLLFPAGAAGPAFLVTENFEVLKTYNFSDAYVLSVAGLADAITGGPNLPTDWPNAPSMSKEDRVALQARLAALGYAVDNREGRVSLALRDVIRAAQTRVGEVPDGNPTTTLLQALRALP